MKSTSRSFYRIFLIVAVISLVCTWSLSARAQTPTSSVEIVYTDGAFTIGRTPLPATELSTPEDSDSEFNNLSLYSVLTVLSVPPDDVIYESWLEPGQGHVLSVFSVRSTTRLWLSIKFTGPVKYRRSSIDPYEFEGGYVWYVWYDIPPKVEAAPGIYRVDVATRPVLGSEILKGYCRFEMLAAEEDDD